MPAFNRLYISGLARMYETQCTKTNIVCTVLCYSVLKLLTGLARAALMVCAVMSRAVTTPSNAMAVIKGRAVIGMR